MEADKRRFKRKLFANTPRQENKPEPEKLTDSLVLALQSKVEALQNKYNDFISKCMKKINKEDPDADSTPNNIIMLKSAREGEKNRKTQSDVDESKEYAQLIEGFKQIEEQIAADLEKPFYSIKQETFKQIHLLKQRLNYLQTEIVFLKNKSLKKTIGKSHCETQTAESFAFTDSDHWNKEFQANCISSLSDELSKSKESIKVLRDVISFNLKGNKQKNVPRLRIKTNSYLSPQSLLTQRELISPSRRLIKKDSFSDRIELDKKTTEKVLNLAKIFEENILKNCEDLCDRKETLFLVLQQAHQDFANSIKKIELEYFEFGANDDKLKEELENCKTVAFMYEKKLKLKNETISALRQKVKKFDEEKDFLKNIFETFCKNEMWKIEGFLEGVNEKFKNLDGKFSELKKTFSMKIEGNLNEIKEALEIANNGQCFYAEIEELRKGIEELEVCNKEIHRRNQTLCLENEKLKSQKNIADCLLRELKEELIETKSLLCKLEDNSETNCGLINLIKIKDFELKQMQFEKNTLGTDKAELLLRIEALEIEIIEAQEAYRDMSVKCNQTIEELIFSNTVQKNQITQLEKPKNPQFVLVKFQLISIKANSSLEKSKKTIENHREIIEDLKLDLYEIKKKSEIFSEKFEEINEKFTEAEEKFAKLLELYTTLETITQNLSEENQIIKSTKSSLFGKISELEEDVKSLTEKLLKISNANSLLEDQIFKYSSSKDLTIGEIRLKEENSKIKIELVQMQTIIETYQSSQYQIEAKLTQVNSMISDLRNKIGELTEEKNFAELAKETMSLENAKLIEQLGNSAKELEKLQKNNLDILMKMKNEDLTSKKNIQFLEQLIKDIKSKQHSNWTLHQGPSIEIKLGFLKRPLEIHNQSSYSIESDFPNRKYAFGLFLEVPSEKSYNSII